MKIAMIAGVAAFILLLGWLLWVGTHPPQRDDVVAPFEELPCAVADECAESPDVPASSVDGDALTLSNGKDLVTIFERTCAACHISGLAGAPRIGNREEWQPRLEKGLPALYHSALIGMPPGMPAKGLCYDCTAGDLQKLVDYIVGRSR